MSRRTMFVLLVILVYSSSYFASGLARNVSSTSRAPIFLCVDGVEISLANVCDGVPDCPDSSDETRKLCHHVVCPTSMYKCAYGACVARASRCNGFDNCADGSDEFRCDSDANSVCSDREFQCSTPTRECISLADTCNGYVDCSDGSDEDPSICREISCPEHSYRCSYGGCVHQEVVCDGVKDCVDGTDENALFCARLNCQDDECENYKCRQNEFSCEAGRECLPNNKICDGIRHCRDSSDEDAELCKSRQCPDGWFRCLYGGCIRPELKCNLKPDCYDWSDEDESLCGTVLPEGACRLPGPRPSTHYLVSECPRCRPGQVVQEFTRLDYACDVQQSLEGPRSVYCQANRWLPSLPICPAVLNVPANESQGITCSPISDSHGAIKRCEAKWGPRKGWLPCEQPVPVGTRAFFECPIFYERVSGSTSAMCLHDGTWSQRPLTCRPACGTRDTSVAALIVNGWEMRPEDSLPWHATLFSREDGEWKFFCGATLIAERAVLTAGHCVWKTSPDTITVALGLSSKDFSKSNEGAQFFNVKSIVLQDSYQDYEGNYGSDLALLILRQPVLINTYVKPACIAQDFYATSIRSQEEGYTGLVAGMGITENDTFSSTLRVTALKIVSDEVCRENQKRDFRKYLTYTTFCAGWTNGTGVCNGDSGGGLVLRKPHSEEWEVHGVVSVSPRRLGTSICDPKHYTVFTKVAVYSEWIRKIVDTIPVVGPPNINRHPNRDEIII